MTDPAFDLEHVRWARARDDYRAGATAAEVCARYELSRSTFYARASAERWRRADLPSAKAQAVEVDDFDPSAARLPSPALADLAHRRITHAVQSGRVREALMWSRLAKELRLLAEDEENKTWRRLHREASDGSPAPVEPQAPVAVEDFGVGLDCPDSFSESEARPDAGGAAADPLHEDEVMGVAMKEEWNAADWAEWAILRAQLCEERPDLPWWTGPGQDGEAPAEGPPPEEPP